MERDRPPRRCWRSLAAMGVKAVVHAVNDPAAAGRYAARGLAVMTNFQIPLRLPVTASANRADRHLNIILTRNGGGGRSA